MSKVDRTLRIVACCGCGNGTCQIVALKLKRVLKAIGVSGNVTPETASAGVTEGRYSDLIVCNEALVSQFTDAAAAARAKGQPFATIIGLVNVMDEREIKEKLLAYLQAAFPD